MPRCRYEIGGTEEARSVTMANGKIVKDIIGIRKEISASWDYVPAADLKELVSVLRNGGFFNVTYEDTDGTQKTESFETVSYTHLPGKCSSSLLTRSRIG